MDFSNTTFHEFFEDEFGVDIYSDEYADIGSSKANRLRSYVKKACIQDVLRLFKALWAIACEEHETEIRRVNERIAAGLKDPEFADLQFSDYFHDQEKFAELCDEISNSTEQPVIADLHSLSKSLDLDRVRMEIDRARASAGPDPEDAVTAACSLLESVCKTVILQSGHELPKKKDLTSLYRELQNHLRLSPNRTDLDDAVRNDVKQVLGGLHTVISGIASLRTHAGDAHGRASGTRRIDPRIAHLAVNASSAASVFILETWQKHTSNEAST